ncbi:hypothetical protein MMC24_003751 [Lignoscripta atroalba]|nr:hypothetical protein [Lignoscripta atroalba]
MPNSFSYSSGQPPTPTRTPTSATFGPNLFLTPKVESSFYDPRVTWNTADPYATSPSLLKTPQQLSFTTLTTERPSSASGQKRPLSGQDLEAEIASHVHHPSPNPSLSLPPVEPCRQLSSSPNPTSKRNRSDIDQPFKSPGLGLELDTSVAMHSASSMQTPPPTSTSASRRKAQQAQVAKLVQQSAANGRRMSVPGFSKGNHGETPTSQVEESPQQFSSLQFSPDVFGFPTSGPATAPIYPQHKLFWDPEQSDDMNIDFSAAMADPFSTGNEHALQPYVSAHHRTSTSQASMLPSFLDFPINAHGTKDHSITTGALPHGQANPVPTSGLTKNASSRTKSIGHAVDPSLLFSSPGRSFEPLTGSISSMAALDMETLQPYAYQMQEAKREQASGVKGRDKKKRGLEKDSPAVKAALESLREDENVRPIIRRSTTDSAVTRSIPTQQIEQVSINRSRNGQTHGRLSPLKQTRKPSKRNGQPLRHRTAVTLTIDPSGRARTETKVVVEDSERSPLGERMDVDSRSVGSDGDTSSEDSGLAITTSHAPSFDFDPRPTKQPKLGRFVTDSRSHSQKSSYTSVYTTSSYADGVTKPAYVKSRAGSNPRSRTSHTLIPSSSLPRSGHESLSDSETVTDASDGTAQSELKKVLRYRAKEEQRKAQTQGQCSKLGPINTNVFMNKSKVASFDLDRDLTPSDSQTLNPFSNISPTTITDPDLATPSTDCGSQSTESTRCVCHVQENDGQMILCESCKKWLHVRCLGLNALRLPQVYLCVFCTGQTPNVRGGRIREPARAGFAPPSSPLAHKSHRFR